MRELRNAALRGVRVRLLLADFYTAGLDAMLLGLASYPNIEVRLFNPFASGRESIATRWISFASKFRRLNHRMHNKLFVVDGAMAIAGDRNLVDEYFLRGAGDNFIDLDLVMAGPVVTELSALFDTAKSDIVMISPYFIPGEAGLAQMRQLRGCGVSMTVGANSLADTDEPLVNINYNNYNNYRVAMLKLGVDL